MKTGLSTWEILLAEANKARGQGGSEAPRPLPRRSEHGTAAFQRGGSGGRDIAAYGFDAAGGTAPVGSFQEGRDLAAAAAQNRMSSSIHKPKYGPARLEEVGPMFMKNRYGPGMLNHLGPISGGGQMPSTAPQGFGQAFRGALGMQRGPALDGGMPGQRMGLPTDTGGMDPLEIALLAVTAAEAGGNIWANYKEGKQRDREYEDEEKRRKAGGRVFGKAFRDIYGR